VFIHVRAVDKVIGVNQVYNPCVDLAINFAMKERDRKGEGRGREGEDRKREGRGREGEDRKGEGRGREV